ncbi:hypothetical protein ES703_116686 [subsurface metagenome]
MLLPFPSLRLGLTFRAQAGSHLPRRREPLVDGDLSLKCGFTVLTLAVFSLRLHHLVRLVLTRWRGIRRTCRPLQRLADVLQPPAPVAVVLLHS